MDVADVFSTMIDTLNIMKTALVVLGMHRSGTSAMAGALSMCGAQLPNLMLSPNFANPKGYFEPASVTEFNDEMLTHLDSDWDTIFAGQPKEYLSNFDHFFLDRGRDVLRNAYASRDFIVLKDPRISVLVNFWDNVLQVEGYRTSYVIMVRHPFEVALSLQARDGFPIEKGLLLWLENMLSCERDTRGKGRVFVSFDDLLLDWRKAFTRIERGAGCTLPRRTAASAQEVDLHLSKADRHHLLRDNASGHYEEAPAFKVCSLAHDWFKGAARDQSPDDSLLSRARIWLEELHKTIDPVLADARTQVSKLKQEIGGQKHALEDAANCQARAELQAANDEITLLRDLNANLQAGSEKAAKQAEEQMALIGERDDLVVANRDLQQQLMLATVSRDQSLTDLVGASATVETLKEAASFRDEEIVKLTELVESLQAQVNIDEISYARLTRELEIASRRISDTGEELVTQARLIADVRAELNVEKALGERALRRSHEFERECNTMRLALTAQQGEHRVSLSRADMLAAENLAIRTENSALKCTIDAIRTSTSWRLTDAPRRIVGMILRRGD